MINLPVMLNRGITVKLKQVDKDVHVHNHKQGFIFFLLRKHLAETINHTLSPSLELLSEIQGANKAIMWIQWCV